MKFITGNAVHQEIEKNAKEAQIRKDSQGAWRFRLQMGEEANITFLDGGLTDGLLTPPSFYEHSVQVAGRYYDYPCTSHEEPCPLCESEKKMKAFVSLFTILDHREWKDSKGNIRKNQRKLYAIKKDTFERLQHIATRPGRNGLAGCTFAVARIGADPLRAAAVGTDFDFIEKLPTVNAIATKFGVKPEEAVPFDYAKEIKYKTAKELRELGFGGAAPLGSDQANSQVAQAPAPAQVAQETDDQSVADVSQYDQQL